MEDSRRNTTAIRSELRKAISTRDSGNNTARVTDMINVECPVEVISYSMISENYWPRIAAAEDDELTLHPAIESEIKRYCDTFTALKKPRGLHPMSRAGLVEVELAFDDGVCRLFTVSPLQVC